MDLQASSQKRINFFTMAISVVLGVAFLVDFVLEESWIFKADDGAVFLIGIASALWYLYKNNKFRRSIVPLLLIYFSLFVKIIGTYVEMANQKHFLNEIGALMLLIAACILATWFYARDKQL